MKKETHRKFLFSAIFILPLFHTNTWASNCELNDKFMHSTKKGDVPIYADKNSLFFTSNMAINTDGAPNSYHPEDLWGSQGKAINTICNGITAFDKNGLKIKYSNCKDMILAYKEAGENNWNKNHYPRVHFFGIASKNGTPCLNKEKRYEGYFVSTTSLATDKSLPICNQDKYLNSLEIPFAIYPGSRAFTSRGVGIGNAVIYYNPNLKTIEYGIIGDRGPKWGLAEGSIAFSKTLTNNYRNPKSRKEANKFAVKKVHAIIFLKHKISPPYTADNIRNKSRQIFEEWGGIGRLNSCIDDIGD